MLDLVSLKAFEQTTVDKYRPFLVEKTSTNMYESHGIILEEKSATKIFQEYAEKKMGEFKNVNSPFYSQVETEIAALLKSFEDLKDRVIKNQKKGLSEGGIEIQQEKQVELAQETQMNVDKEVMTELKS